MAGKQLESGWVLLMPVLLMPLVALLELSFSEWRLLTVTAFLATLIMLFHKRLRHLVLLPSCIALVGGLMAITLNFTTL